MTLDEARAWAAARLVEGYTSDGCTLVRDFNFTDCCRMHDLLRRLGPIPAPAADRLLRLCIADRGHPLLAWVYWLTVVLARRLRFYR